MLDSLKWRLVANRYVLLSLLALTALLLGASLFLSMAQTRPLPSMSVIGLPPEVRAMPVQATFQTGLNVDVVNGVNEVSQEWQVLFANNFEGTIDIGEWDVQDGNGATGGEYFWGQTSYTAASPSNSLWAIGDGAEGSGLDPAVDTYPDGVDSRFIILPVDLRLTIEAQLQFQVQMLTQPGDQLQVLASNDGQNWEGMGIVLDGLSATDWFSVTVYPNQFVGKGSVWFAIRFVSNQDGVGDGGVFVDDVYLRVKTGNQIYLPAIVRQLPPTPTPTPTLEPTPEVPVIKIIQVYAHAGPLPVAYEYVIIQNQGSASQNMMGWRLTDAGPESSTYIFPQFTLGPGASVKIWSRCGYDDDDELFWCTTKHVWDSHDTAYLYNLNGQLVDSYSY